MSAATWHSGASWGQERLSATTLETPGLCSTSPMHSAMKESCLCCQGVHCPWLRDSVEGCQQQLVVGLQLELVALQSKPEVADGCEGSQCSLSKAEYLQSAAESFLEKNPHGRQPFTSFFCQGKLRMRKRVHLRSGGCKGCLDGTERRLQGADQSSSLGLPLRHSVRGWSVRAASCRKWR